MNWLKTSYWRISYQRVKTAVYNKTSSYSRKRAEKNITSIRSRFVGLEVGNFCVALSTTGLMAIGVIPMSLPTLIVLALMLLVIGIIGGYIDAVEDDVERLLKYEKYIRENPDCRNTGDASSDSVQQQSD